MQKLNIDLSKVKKEYMALAYVILAVIIVFVAYKNIFTPLLKKSGEMSTQLEQRKRDIQKAKISPQALKELEDEINGIKTRVAYYQQKLPALADIPQILKELNQIAEGLKIKFDSVNPLERKESFLPGDEELLIEIPIRIKMQCGYHQLGIFINQLENSTRFMKIMELKLNANARNVWEHRVELVISSYRLIPK